MPVWFGLSDTVCEYGLVIFEGAVVIFKELDARSEKKTDLSIFRTSHKKVFCFYQFSALSKFDITIIVLSPLPLA
jgi:hypothetical protein